MASSSGRHFTAFAPILQQERELLKLGEAADPTPGNPAGVGLALSGGGIRSASFALGVVQQLFNLGFFKNIHYLSTVSGGGYLGSALTWLAGMFESSGQAAQFGSATRGARDAELAEKKHLTPQVWLDFVRQHGNYLKPARIGDLSLGGIALRGTLLSYATYVLAAAVLIGLLCVYGVLEGPPEPSNLAHPRAALRIESLMLLFGSFTGLMIAIYGIATWLGSVHRLVTIIVGALMLAVLIALTYAGFRALGGVDVDLTRWWRWPLFVTPLTVTVMSAFYLWKAVMPSHAARSGTTQSLSHSAWQYESRASVQQQLGLVLSLLIGTVVLWTVPVLYKFLLSHAAAWQSASLSSVAGAAVALYQFVAGQEREKTSSVRINLVLIVGAVLLLYGSLLFAYMLAPSLLLPAEWAATHFEIEWLASPAHSMWVAFVLIALFGLVANVNMIGIARMYRDRLMETFMPEREAIERNEWRPAVKADVTPITRFKDVKPLHLINCNVVMIDAERDAFRGRGGDSFVISPLYSGSSATGWVRTEDLGTGGDRFTLATAMAISAAAANPNTGSAGRGITRNRAVAFLLSLLNIRLGYWIKNPGAARSVAWLAFGPPNFWFPGLHQGLLGRGLNEKASFVELTDGGHFDNTALYELVRRRTRFIVLSQGSQDGEFAMADLANAIERVRVDFGVHIRFDVPGYELDKLRPAGTPDAFSSRGFAVGRIRYPRHPGSGDGELEYGALLYLQAVPVQNMRADVQSFWRSNPPFPNEPTANQFFTEEQLEAYRELGIQIAEGALQDLCNKPRDPASPDAGLLSAFASALRGPTEPLAPAGPHTPGR